MSDKSLKLFIITVINLLIRWFSFDHFKLCIIQFIQNGVIILITKTLKILPLSCRVQGVVSTELAKRVTVNMAKTEQKKLKAF